MNLIKYSLMGEVKKKVLSEIKDEKIEPKPRWQFLVKDYMLWSAFVLAVFIGAVSTCVIMDILTDNDWDIYKYVVENPIQRVILSLPFLWLGVLVILWILAYLYYKLTKCGYKYSSYRIIGFSILASIVLGVFLNLCYGIGERVETMVAENIPFYSTVNSHCSNKEIWMHPEKGLLAGKIVEMSAPDCFALEDFSGTTWIVKKSGNIFIRGKLPLKEKEEVKIIGEEEKRGVFKALEIRRWARACTESRKKEEKDDKK